MPRQSSKFHRELRLPMSGEAAIFPDPAFDLVIIDESEQVFSHLVGDTITRTQGGLDRCYDALVFEIQVLMCSPSLGTGINITFPDPQCLEESGLCKVDCVWLLLPQGQHPHRYGPAVVACPKSASQVWISPTRFQYASNFDVIRDDLARARVVPRAVTGYASDGLTNYNPTDPLLLIYTHVVAAQRASKNNLIELFCDLRRSQGGRSKGTTNNHHPTRTGLRPRSDFGAITFAGYLRLTMLMTTNIWIFAFSMKTRFCLRRSASATSAFSPAGSFGRSDLRHLGP